MTSYDRPKVSCDTVADFYGTPIENPREPCIFKAFVYDLLELSPDVGTDLVGPWRCKPDDMAVPFLSHSPVIRIKVNIIVLIC